MPVSVIVTDTAGVVLHWNRYAESLFGWSAAETMGRHVERFTVAAEDAGALHAIFGVVTQGEIWEGPFPATRRDGARAVIHVVDAPLLDEDNTIVAAICLSVDVADSLRAERNRANNIVRDVLSKLASNNSPNSGSVALPQVGTSALSQRELEILALLRDRLQPRRIAERLGISYATVRNHIASIYRKLGVHSQQELHDLIGD
jgi:PAS domain S-box-containing protein